MQTHYEPPEQRILTLELDRRTNEALSRLGISTLGDLSEWSEQMLLEAGLQSEQLRALKIAMRGVGMMLADDRMLFRGETELVVDAELDALTREYQNLTRQAEDGIRVAATEAAIVL